MPLKTLTENTYVKLGTVISIMIALAYMIIAETEYRTNQRRDFQELLKRMSAIEKTVDKLDKRIVGKTPEGWHRQDMYLWILETEAQNKGWQGADPYSKQRDKE